MTQASTPNPIYYMRDEQTFRRLSDNVDTALDEIRNEFSQGYSYGSLCSKRKNFKMIHAGGSDQLEPFLAECRTALAPQAMLTAAKAQQTHGLLLWATLDEALDAYWSAAYAEGQRGATHDTKDGRAQCALEAVRSCVRLAVAAEREACAAKVSRNYGWVNGVYFDNLADVLRSNAVDKPPQVGLDCRKG